MESPTDALPRVYVVALGRFGGADYAGVSCDKDRVWFQHMSSSLWYLKSDCTTGFPDRRAELEKAYPDGFETVLIDLADGGSPPAEIAHHFTKAEA